ncbi:hypothetical protein [Tianweitania sp.]|uniref:hypothetical protein n=1 Tax=Tianweitania sp. TaxID=2021634 RepID=UPI00289A1D14|nr:hypothetical protein [Tianweitania sp.]
MDLNDKRWSLLQGGYRAPYDASAALQRLASGDMTAWEELWEELHHQSDVGEASYAALPEIVRLHKVSSKGEWNTYALAATIERSRLNGRNPPLPDWLKRDYDAAWAELQKLALQELPQAANDALADSIIAVLALTKGRRTLAGLVMLTEDERQEIVSTYGVL